MNHYSLLLCLGFLLTMGAMCQKPKSVPAPGVSKVLAELRYQYIKGVYYRLHFDIPSNINQSISGNLQLEFELAQTNEDLILDFPNSSGDVHAIKMDSNDVYYSFANGHIIIPKSYLQKGKNSFQITFTAGEQALNRNEDFLYTLFVPNKAATAFPCFDQPNMKAKYELSLSVPSDWEAVANYPLKVKQSKDSLTYYGFEPTLPISSYLFAFAAGKFFKITETIDGREMNMYHRETNEEKVAANASQVFDLHAKSLKWLEEYTAIDHPFKKFDFVLIPAFQFGGMEHPGAIFYKARSLFLDENATLNQKMSRNSLIAHETAHMWFGNLVTMNWFNDVWLKEVFANFMAAKMVNPNFPEINHDLRFLQRHHPTAYNEDRSDGTHPIQQELDNLNQASLLYGRIIYQKAPVVMKQLESVMGEEAFKEGLQEYLKAFSYDNATWDDLIQILDKRTDLDLKSWSQAWVKESGMPHLRAKLEVNDGKVFRYSLVFQNQTSGNLLWEQNSVLLISKDGKTERFPITIGGQETAIDALNGEEAPDFILPHMSEGAYGYFELDEKSKEYLLTNVHNIDDSFVQLVAWLSLWEGMLRGQIDPQTLMQTILRGLPYEKDLIGMYSRLGYLRNIYWLFSTEEERLNEYANLGETLWDLMANETSRDKKKYLYDAFISVSQSEEGVEKLYDLWSESLTIPNFNLSEQDLTTLAYELAVKEHPQGDSILQAQLQRLTNPDRKAAMEFIIPALSSDIAVRDQFFESLKFVKNRQKEPWVNTALGYFNHPLRAKESEKYIRPSLELVKEIQETGGIFFPKSWAVSVLSGHSSASAWKIVEDFVEQLPDDYPQKLKNKILQASDMLKRRAMEVDNFE